MNDKQLITVLGKAGFRGKALRTAFGIAKRESGGRPDAFNPDRSTGDQSYGLFQINMLGSMGPARRKQFGLERNEDLFDPVTSAKAAFRMSNGGKDFGAWGIGPNAYRSGAGYDTIAKWADSAPVGPVRRGTPTRADAFKMPDFELPTFDAPKPGASFTDDLDFDFDSVPGLKIDEPPGFKPQRDGSLIDPLPPLVAEKQARKWGGTTLDQGPARAPTPQVQKAIAIAKQQIGKPYVFGSAGSSSFDCSGLIEFAFEQAGIPTPGRMTTGTMIKMGKPVGWDNIQPGDWIVRHSGDSGHVVMYVGNGQVIAAPRTGEVVQFQPLSSFKSRGDYQVRRWSGGGRPA